MDSLRSLDGHRRGVIDDCWNTIGVRGDRSCPRLKQHVHCRNCPVYSQAAESLLDRELNDEQIAAWTRHYAQEKPTEGGRLQSAFIFRIAGEWLALPTRVLDAVVEARTIHSLPHRTNRIVLGLVNVRGELLICVSLSDALDAEAAREQKPVQGRLSHQRLLVLSRGTSRFVAPVDQVHGTLRFSPEQLVSAPATVTRAAATYTSTMLPWDGKAVGCIDDALLFDALDRSLA